MTAKLQAFKASLTVAELSCYQLWWGTAPGSKATNFHCLYPKFSSFLKMNIYFSIYCLPFLLPLLHFQGPEIVVFDIFVKFYSCGFSGKDANDFFANLFHILLSIWYDYKALIILAFPTPSATFLTWSFFIFPPSFFSFSS